MRTVRDFHMVEGALNAKMIWRLAHDVDLPLARTVRAIVWEDYDAVAATQIF